MSTSARYGLRWALQIAVLCAVAMTFSGSTHAATRAQSWRIDEAQTWIGFKIDAVGFPTTHGHFAHYRGQVRLDFDRPAKSFTTFTVESGFGRCRVPGFQRLRQERGSARRRKISDDELCLDASRKARRSHGAGHRQPHHARREQADHADGQCRDRTFGQRRLDSIRSKGYDRAIGFRDEIRRPADRRRTRDHHQVARA